jgi:glycosyltransferase involved in cell wall biosynthesis
MAAVAIVTPYYKEDRRLLERCLDSVRRQTVPSDHLLVSDGHPQPWLDDAGVRHLKLDRAHGDWGNTPRGIGAQLAIAEGYEAVAFLDADNWFDHDHVETCLRAAASLTGDRADCDYVVAQRRMVRPDLSVMDGAEEPGHVDTSCFFFLPGAFFMVPYWNLMPRQFAAMGDRVFNRHIAARGLAAARTDKVTVNYLNLYASTYLARGEIPPAGAKPNADPGPAFAWFAGLTPRMKLVVERLMGLKMRPG